MKKYIATSLMAAGMVASVSAQDYTIYCNGSTATRTDVYAALTQLFASTGAYQHAGAHGDNYFTFQGKWPADGSALQNKIVEVFYSANGSANGQQHIVNQDPITYITLAGVQFSHVADVAFSDVYQSSAGVVGSETDQQIAVITFTFARSINAPNTIVNMTGQNFAELWSFGSTTLDIFTGNPADAGTPVVCSGRDGGSGTRITALLETGYGLNPVAQNYNALFTQNADGSKTRGANQAAWAAFGLFDPATGQNDGDGWSSGSGVKGDLQNAGCAEAGVGYVGLNDTPGAALQINYNGYAFSPAAVEQANYTYWGYEHCFVRGDAPTHDPGAAGFQSAFPALINASLTSATFVMADGANYTPGAATLPLSVMDCSRSIDGGHVSHF